MESRELPKSYNHSATNNASPPGLAFALCAKNRYIYRCLGFLRPNINCMEEIDPELRELYPHFTDEELRESQENLEEYLKVVLRIYERMKADEDIGSRNHLDHKK